MTTKVKVKKTRAERKQHSRDMQAKHEAEKKAANLRNILKRDILATLGIPKNHGGRAALSTFITEHLLKGESQVQIVAMLTGSELMKRAQLAEIERLKKIFDAPANAAFQVWTVDRTGSARPISESQYFDAELNFEPKGYAERLEWLAPYGATALFAAGGPIRARSPLGTVAVRPFGTLGATGGPFGAFGALRPFGTFLRLVPRVVEISGVAGISGRIAFDGHGGVLVRGLSSRRDMKVP